MDCIAIQSLCHDTAQVERVDGAHRKGGTGARALGAGGVGRSGARGTAGARGATTRQLGLRQGWGARP